MALNTKEDRIDEFESLFQSGLNSMRDNMTSNEVCVVIGRLFFVCLFLFLCLFLSFVFGCLCMEFFLAPINVLGSDKHTE
jgi:hypothetical protein